jgi:hypothetical protein
LTARKGHRRGVRFNFSLTLADNELTRNNPPKKCANGLSLLVVKEFHPLLLHGASLQKTDAVLASVETAIRLAETCNAVHVRSIFSHWDDSIFQIKCSDYEFGQTTYKE